MLFPTKEFTHQAFDQVKPARYGSIREKKVNPDLQEERDKCNFDQKELTKIIYGNDIEFHNLYKRFTLENKELQTTPEFYEMTREEQMERSMRQFSFLHSHPEIRKHHQSKSFITILLDYMQGQVRRITYSDSLFVIYLTFCYL
jgi:hypothetical protein